jgi:hypothetical protein
VRHPGARVPSVLAILPLFPLRRSYRPNFRLVATNLSWQAGCHGCRHVSNCMSVVLHFGGLMLLQYRGRGSRPRDASTGYWRLQPELWAWSLAHDGRNTGVNQVQIAACGRIHGVSRFGLCAPRIPSVHESEAFMRPVELRRPLCPPNKLVQFHQVL